MPQSKVIVTLEGRDELSDDLRKLSKAVSQLGRDFSKVSATGGKSFAGLEGVIRGSIIQVGLLGAAVTGAMSAASSAIGSAISGYESLQQTQRAIISDADALNDIINEGFENTRDLLREERIELESLAIDYGVTGSYAVGVFNNLKDEVARVAEFTGDSLDEAFGKLQRTAVSLAAVGETEGVTTGQINNLLSKFTAGTLTEGELKELDIANNPKFAAAIDAAKNGLGIEDISELAQLTLEQRLQFIELLGKDLELSAEALEANQKLARTHFKKFHNALFGENGLFSFTREIENIKGDQTLFDAINQIGVTIFGEDGLLYAFGNAFERITGLDGNDLVAEVYKGFVRIDNFLYRLTKFFNQLQPLSDGIVNLFSGPPSQLANFLNSITSGFGDVDLSDQRNAIVDVVNNMLRGIASADLTPFFSNVGSLLGEIVNEGILGIADLDFNAIGNILLNSLSNTVAAVGSFLVNLDPSVYIAGGVALFAAGATLLVGQIILALAAPVLAAIGAAVAAAIGGVAALPVLLIGGLVLIVVGLAKILYDNWDSIRGWFGEIFTNIGNAISSGWQWLSERLSETWDSIKQGFNDAFQPILDIFNWIGNSAQNLWNVITGNGSIAATVPSSSGSGAGRITNRADGFVGGLVAAAIREGRMAPPNTQLYVGNSSEMTLTRGDQSALAQRLSQPQALPNITFGNIIVSSNASDTKQVAKEVMREIEYQLAQRINSQLASSVT